MSEQTSIQKSNGRDAVFVLDDRQDMVETTTDYFESIGVPTVSADNIDDAWKRLMQEEENIRVALIDKNIYQERDGGVSFLKEAREKFPKVKFFLITGWTLLQTERETIEAAGIDWLDKGTLLPANLVALYQSPHVGQLRGRVSINTLPYNIEPIDNLKPYPSQENVLQSSFRDETIQVLRLENSTLRRAVKSMAGDLVERLRNDGFDADEQAIFLNGQTWSVEELIEEVETCSTLGLKLIDLHFAVIDDLLDDKRKDQRK